jgi:hypothetical protein
VTTVQRIRGLDTVVVVNSVVAVVNVATDTDTAGAAQTRPVVAALGAVPPLPRRLKSKIEIAKNAPLECV